VLAKSAGEGGDDFDDEALNTYRCGYLFKTGSSNRFWRRRWFVFDDDVLRYYKEKDDKEPAGVIMLADMISIAAREDPAGAKQFFFELQSCVGRTYELAADNLTQMLDWLNFLKVIIDSTVLAHSKHCPFIPLRS